MAPSLVGAHRPVRSARQGWLAGGLRLPSTADIAPPAPDGRSRARLLTATIGQNRGQVSALETASTLTARRLASARQGRCSGLCPQLCLTLLRLQPFPGDRGAPVRVSHARSRPVVDGGAQSSTACDVALFEAGAPRCGALHRGQGRGASPW